MPRPLAILAATAILTGCVNSPISRAGIGDFSRTPEARGVSGVNERATTILTRIVRERDD